MASSAVVPSPRKLRVGLGSTLRCLSGVVGHVPFGGSVRALVHLRAVLRLIRVRRSGPFRVWSGTFPSGVRSVHS